VKRLILEKHLRAQGCYLDREGANHSIWVNPVNSQTSPMNRHAEIPYFTAVAICKQLGIEIIRKGK
jgi:hypothetical protein